MGHSLRPRSYRRHPGPDVQYDAPERLVDGRQGRRRYAQRATAIWKKTLDPKVYEVRELGASLGIARDILWRHPFPGPGLAVRCPGIITEDRLEIIRECDAIFISRLKEHGWYDKVWQAYAALVPVKTVGVKGDERSYEWAIALRAVISEDAMTADWVELPYALLRETSHRILNEVKGINRVLYDISTKPPASIEWE